MSNDKKCTCGSEALTGDPGPVCPLHYGKPSPIDAAKAYTDERIDKLREVAVERFRTLATRVEELEKLGERIDSVWESIGQACERLAALEESAKGVAVPLFNVQERIAKLEAWSESVAKILDSQHGWLETTTHDIRSLDGRVYALENPVIRGLASQAEGAGPPDVDPWPPVPDEPDDGREPAPSAGTNSEPSREPSLMPGASAGTAKAETEAPIAIEPGQVWRGWGRVVRVERALDDGWWRIVGVEHGQRSDANSEWFRDATLVEPAPVVDHRTAPLTDAWDTISEPAPGKEPTTTVLPARPDVVLNGVFVSHPKHWAANVPEPPPVEVLEYAIGELDYIDDAMRSAMQGSPNKIGAVLDWLRAVAAAMGAEEGRGDGE